MAKRRAISTPAPAATRGESATAPTPAISTPAAARGESATAPIPTPASPEFSRRAQFERDLAVVEACRSAIDAIAFQLNPLTATPEQIAHQMIANTTIVTQVAALMNNYHIIVAYTDDKSIAAIPHPIRINHNQTMLNFDRSNAT